MKEDGSEERVWKLGWAHYIYLMDGLFVHILEIRIASTFGSRIIL